jgi:hypothetical protein
MTIVGDPAWLQQGESFVGLPKGAPYYFNAFLPDGTINFDSQQILFAVGYNRPSDYNLETGVMETGLMDPSAVTQKNQQYNNSLTTNADGLSTKENRVYIAKEVQNRFAKGKFTQVLKGSLVIYTPTKEIEITDKPKTAAVQGAKVQSKAPAWKSLAPGTAADAAKIPEQIRGKESAADVFRPVLQQIDPKTLLPIRQPANTPLPGTSTVVKREF